MEFNKGDQIEKTMWLVEGKIVDGKNGPYWAGKFMVDQETIPAKLWGSGRFEDQVKLLKPGNPFKVKAKADEYNGVKQIIIQEVKQEAGTIDKTQFLPSSAFNKDDMISEFEEIIEAVEDKDYKNLLREFRASPIFQEFAVAPAAKMIHHAWISGLLEHSLFLARAVSALAPLYPGLDKSLLVAGAFLHDVGKAAEISAEPGFDYTTEGKLFGHIYMGAKSVEDLIEKIDNFPLEKKRRIIHLILSHQGERTEGFGSPVDPSTVEAVFFHHLDNLDAKVRHSLTAIENSEEKEGFIKTPLPLKLSLYLGEGPATMTTGHLEPPTKSTPKSGLFEEE